MAPRSRRVDAPVPHWRAFLVPKPSVTDLTVGEVARLWLAYAEQRGRRSMRDARSVVTAHLVPSFGGLDARALAPEHVVAWVQAYQAGDYAPATIRRLVSYLSQVCEHGRRLGALEVNPCARLPRGTLPPKRARDPQRMRFEVLTAAQVEALLVRAPQMRRQFWALVLLAGLRFGEAAALTWGQVSHAKPLDEIVVDRSWDCRERRLGPTKTGEVRRVPVHPRLRRLLERAREWFRATYQRDPRGGDLVAPFVHMHRDARDPQPWHETTALKWWRRDLAEAGVPRPAAGPRKIHAARHTFISLLARAGVAEDIRKAMTHTTNNGDAHSAYVHFDWATLCDAVCKLGVGL